MKVTVDYWIDTTVQHQHHLQKGKEKVDTPGNCLNPTKHVRKNEDVAWQHKHVERHHQGHKQANGLAVAFVT